MDNDLKVFMGPTIVCVLQIVMWIQKMKPSKTTGFVLELKYVNKSQHAPLIKVKSFKRSCFSVVIYSPFPTTEWNCLISLVYHHFQPQTGLEYI